MAVRIEAGEVSVRELFDATNFFHVPTFQRPFSWEKDNFEKLVDDIQDAIDANLERAHRRDSHDLVGAVRNFEPYFLGSVILNAATLGDGNAIVDYSIVDGQQRLVSLSILIAVMRDHLGQAGAEQKDLRALQGKLLQSGSRLEGIPERPRIKLDKYSYGYEETGSRFEHCFHQYVMCEGGTLEAEKVRDEREPEPVQRMLEAIRVFSDHFEGRNLNELSLYMAYLLQKVILVQVTTTSEASAFRLFNVLNTRGMPLSNADILKSVNLSAIPKENRKHYAHIWGQLEERYGAEGLEDLIGLIRTMELKNKARKTIHEEFTENVFTKDPDLKGARFVEHLSEVADVYSDRIQNANIVSGDANDDTYYHNLVALMNSYIPYRDWMAALIRFFQKFDDQTTYLDFARKLEARVAVDWIGELSFTARLGTIYSILRVIDESAEPMEVLTSAVLNGERANLEEDLRSGLDHHSFYRKGRYQKPRYVLLRIDMERHYNRNKRIEVVGNVTVEHILPQTPTDEYWTSRFTEDERLRWTHRLGNLTLLDGRKNYQVSNNPFPKKVNQYFIKRSDFSVVEELRAYDDWNPSTVEHRHRKLIEEAVRIWLP